MDHKLLIFALYLTLTLSAYDQTVGRQLVILGSIAYEEPTKIEGWSCADCKQFNLTDINLFSHGPKALFGYVGYSQSLQTIVVSFRGTVKSKLPNLVTDIKVYQSIYPKCTNCRVHTGFYEGISLLSSSLIAALRKVVNAHPGAPIYVGGHSLGGALAILAAPIIKENFPNNKLIQVITGGKPRLGNK
jgi:predicted lipase